MSQVQKLNMNFVSNQQRKAQLQCITMNCDRFSIQKSIYFLTYRAAIYLSIFVHYISPITEIEEKFA